MCRGGAIEAEWAKEKLFDGIKVWLISTKERP